MIAFSLSGGGNRGPVQVGALRALFEAGIRPEMLVGSSAGALNSAFLASDPTPEGNERLARIWLQTTPGDIFPDPRWRQILRVLFGGNGLNSDAAVRRYFLKHMPPGIQRFGDLKVKLYLTTADLQTGRLYLYGDNPQALLIDAALASSAMPVMWDPQVLNGHQFVDGGVVANIPISIAVDKGADTVYALDLQHPGPYPLKKGALDIGLHSIGVQTYQQALYDIQRAVRSRRVTLHYINLGDIFNGIALEDLSHTAEMIELGYHRAQQYLASPTPNALMRPLTIAGELTPPGAVPYNPPF